MNWIELTHKTVYNVRNIAEYTLRTLIEAFNLYSVLSMHVGKANHALDLGCGYGRLTYVIKLFADHVVGLDVRSEVIELAKEAYRDFAEIEFYTYDGANIPYPDLYFDLVVTNTVLQHVKHIDKLSDEIMRVCDKFIIAIEETKGKPVKGMYPRSITEYAELFDEFELIQTYPRYTLINGEVRIRGSIMIFKRV